MAAPLPVSAKDLIPFTPSGYEPEEVVYLLAVPTLEAEARWERAVAAKGAGFVTKERLRTALRDAVNALLAGDAHQAAIEDLDAIDELDRKSAESDGKLGEEDLAAATKLLLRITELGVWAISQWPPYAQLNAEEDFWFRMKRDLAAKYFLRGWQGTIQNGNGNPLEFKKGPDGLVTNEVLEKLPRSDVFEIGIKAWSLVRLASERRKN